MVPAHQGQVVAVQLVVDFCFHALGLFGKAETVLAYERSFVAPDL
jgi:hypothetical protein